MIHPRSMPVLALGILGASVLSVGYLADSAREHDGASRIDSTTTAKLLDTRTPLATALARILTFAGSEAVVGVVALLVLAGLLWRRRMAHALPFALAMGGSAVLTVVVKLLVARHRPPAADALGAVDHSYSFPSGHTLNSAVLIALLIWLVWDGASAASRVGLVGCGALLALGIGVSRVYLGYHWGTDVCASWLVALGWLSVVYLVSGPLLKVARTWHVTRGVMA